MNASNPSMMMLFASVFGLLSPTALVQALAGRFLDWPFCALQQTARDDAQFSTDGKLFWKSWLK
jgi:hypothetical protein